MNPYSGRSSYQFWRRSVASVPRREFDPVSSAKFKLSSDDRIATAGSCFAQHIAREIQRIGYNYLVTEAGEGLSQSERDERNFGVFSARFGNIYTTRQLRQLFEEAFRGVVRHERAWVRNDGRYVDPYRPAIEPAGFASPNDVEDSRAEHLQCVRAMFQQASVFVFTLGLTEAWVSKVDGAVFPLAPGVSGGDFDPRHHAFINVSVTETIEDLDVFVQELRRINGTVKIILTVSPVPLLATYEDRNVLVSTTYSKSVLRVAADELSRKYDWVEYFPSYEIIAGSYNFGSYYCEDAREVNAKGVAHVMRVFTSNYVLARPGEAKAALVPALAATRKIQFREIVCDEERIEQSNARALTLQPLTSTAE